MGFNRYQDEKKIDVRDVFRAKEIRKILVMEMYVTSLGAGQNLFQ